MNVYNDKILKYPLTPNEIKHLDAVWKFIRIFNKSYLYICDYRDYLIKKINKRYTMDEFYLYESIANKLYWNLRHRLLEYFPQTETKCKLMKYVNGDDLDHKIRKIDQYLGSYYRSFINKLIIIDPTDHTIYYKKMEGSSEIFNKNNFNLVTMHIFMNHEIYERLMNDPSDYKKLELPEYYYQFDYGFPNINTCVYKFGTDETRKYRIKKLYFDGKSENWVKLIYK